MSCSVSQGPMVTCHEREKDEPAWFFLTFTFSKKKKVCTVNSIWESQFLTLIAVTKITNSVPFRKIPTASNTVIWGKEKLRELENILFPTCWILNLMEAFSAHLLSTVNAVAFRKLYLFSETPWIESFPPIFQQTCIYLLVTVSSTALDWKKTKNLQCVNARFCPLRLFFSWTCLPFRIWGK